MKSEFAVEKGRAEQIARDYAQKQTQNLALIAFYERHPDVRFCDANTKMITDYVGGTEYVSEENLELAITHEALRRRLVWQTPGDEKLRLIEECAELMKGGTSAEGIAHWRDRLARLQPVEQLRAKKIELEQRAALRSKTPQELREMIRRPQAGFEPVPPLMQSRSMILSASPAELRNLVKRCGQAAINEILSRRDED